MMGGLHTPGINDTQTWAFSTARDLADDSMEEIHDLFKEAKEHILYENFVNVNREVEQMCLAVTQFAKK